ncbi:MAG: HNH endonuclease [Solirubrobacteraceae bacterium]
MADERPPIPDPIKREVRQRCAFGCVICGIPLYEYDHIVPYSEVQEHTSDNLVLLCDRHHREKTNNLLPNEQLAAAAAAPFNVQHGESSPYLVHYGGTRAIARLGSNSYVWAQVDHQYGFTVPLVIDLLPVLIFTVQRGNLLLTAQIFGPSNELLVHVLRNEFVYSVAPWDIEFIGQRLVIRSGPGDILLALKFDPPSTLTVERATLWHNGVCVEVE